MNHSLNGSGQNSQSEKNSTADEITKPPLKSPTKRGKTAKGEVSCADKTDTGLMINGQPLVCSSLLDPKEPKNAQYCGEGPPQSGSPAARVREACPLSCGTCTEEPAEPTSTSSKSECNMGEAGIN